MDSASFGAGCFWGVEAAFRKTRGVTDTAVGYMGGHTADPTYQDVCTGQTFHAEVVKVTFDPKIVSYAELLNVFFTCHNPTELNRQGPDTGTQYRSVIFYYSDDQKRQAEDAKTALEKSGRFKKPVATEITKAPQFYRAEDYHQKYLEKRGLDTCHL